MRACKMRAQPMNSHERARLCLRASLVCFCEKRLTGTRQDSRERRWRKRRPTAWMDALSGKLHGSARAPWLRAINTTFFRGCHVYFRESAAAVIYRDARRRVKSLRAAQPASRPRWIEAYMRLRAINAKTRLPFARRSVPNNQEAQEPAPGAPLCAAWKCASRHA